MLEKRILATLRFFDLQNTPLTILEVKRFLLSPMNDIRSTLDDQYEISPGKKTHEDEHIDLADIIDALESLCAKRFVGHKNGFYYLPGKLSLVSQRIRGYSYGIRREKRIQRYIPFLSHIPFVRGVAVAGSQALGLERKESDIDLLILTHKKFMWVARFCVTTFFHICGVRRYKNKIANRFCLNHYVARVREIAEHKNVYTASEYAKLRPVVAEGLVEAFQLANMSWIKVFFPASVTIPDIIRKPRQSPVQKLCEFVLYNRVGFALENFLRTQLLPRIKKEKYIVVKEDELSFHPHSKQEYLLSQFFNAEYQEQGESLELIV